MVACQDRTTMKKCNTCKTMKPHEEFNTNVKRKDGLQTDCKSCRAEYNRNHYKGKKDMYISSVSRNRGFGYERHKLSVEEYNELFEINRGICIICDLNEATVVDHDHTCCQGPTGCSFCVRGIICSNCNCGLGFFSDNVEALRNAVAYLGG